MSGFAVAATRLAAPDTGLISYAEALDQGRNICSAVSIPVIGDADTGYGNALNVKRTVEGYAQAGFACLMIEDQLAPKRCGHTRGKEVVDRGEALGRIRAAVDARNEGSDILILARTDARATLGIDEAIWRAKAFADLGADILFVEAPVSEAEMERICAEVPSPGMANLVEGGDTPLLAPARLEAIGYQIAAYPAHLVVRRCARDARRSRFARSGRVAQRTDRFRAAARTRWFRRLRHRTRALQRFLSARPAARARATVHFRPPAVVFEFEAIGRVEFHAFTLEELALNQVAAGFGARADLTARIDDAVPGNAFDRERAHRITDLPRATIEAREVRDLPVGGDAAARDAPHHRVDPVVMVSAQFHSPHSRAARSRGRALEAFA